MSSPAPETLGTLLFEQFLKMSICFSWCAESTDEPFTLTLLLHGPTSEISYTIRKNRCRYNKQAEV